MSEHKLFTLRQAAELLQINERDVRHFLRNGYLPGYKFGRIWRISPDDLDSFIRKNGNIPRDELRSGNASKGLDGAQLKFGALRPRKKRRSVETTKTNTGTREVRSDQPYSEIEPNWAPPWREDK